MVAEPARAVAYNHDGSHLAVGTTKGSIRVLLGSDMSKLLAHVSWVLISPTRPSDDITKHCMVSYFTKMFFVTKRISLP